MTQEEKAKAYDEAIERATQLSKQGGTHKYLVCQIFPELKESKDEEIRKALMRFIEAFPYERLENNGVSVKETLAYLEKQGEQKPAADFVEEPDFFDNFRKTDSEVEPKFRAGDWIVNNISKDVFLIKSINNGYCTLEDIKGNIISPCLSPCESESHLWTIQDAKDGDVLDFDCGVGIFKKVSTNGYNAHCYCYYGSHIHQLETDECALYDVYEAKPATKEQRDQLEKAMADAGYAFDFAKKELKKVEQNLTWTDYDEYVYNEILKRVEKKKLYEHDLEYIYNWLKFIKDRVGCEVNCTTTKQWSEEDEKLLKLSLENLTELKDRFGEEYGRVDGCINWLKSLRPQNWTKEDKERYISCLQRLGTGNPEQPETINSKWFKEHVYPKNTWKPSDEQMEVLQESIGIVGQLTPRGECLKELAEQLKKLKGE